MPLSTFGIPLLTAIGDSVDEGGTISIKPVVNWKWKVDGLYPRNPEAFKPDGGAIWTTGEKGNIFEDQYFYVPKDFSWLGEQFKNVKSLVSGIGLKITNIEGEKFTKDMKGVSYKSVRSGYVKKNTKIGTGVLTRKVNLRRVVYYRPDKNVPTWEFGEGICAIRGKIKEQDVFLFVGFIEVSPKNGGGMGAGTPYSIPGLGREVFIKKQMCGMLGWSQSYGLVKFNIQSTTRLETSRTVIGLGPAGKGNGRLGYYPGDLRNQLLVGTLMGLGIEIKRSENTRDSNGRTCWNWTKGGEDNENQLGMFCLDQRALTTNTWDGVIDILKKNHRGAVSESKKEWETRIEKDKWNAFKNGKGWKILEEQGKQELRFDSTRRITESTKLKLENNNKWVPWENENEQVYTWN